MLWGGERRSELSKAQLTQLEPNYQDKSSDGLLRTECSKVCWQNEFLDKCLIAMIKWGGHCAMWTKG